MAKIKVDGEELDVLASFKYLKTIQAIRCSFVCEDGVGKRAVIETDVESLEDYHDFLGIVKSQVNKTVLELCNAGAFVVDASMLDKDGIFILDKEGGSYKKVVFQIDGAYKELTLTADDKKFIASLSGTKPSKGGTAATGPKPSKGGSAATGPATYVIDHVKVTYDTTVNDLVFVVDKVLAGGPRTIYSNTNQGKTELNKVLRDLYSQTGKMDLNSLVTSNIVEFQPFDVYGYYTLRDSKRFLDKKSANHPDNKRTPSTDSIENVEVFLDSDNKTLKVKYDLVAADGRITPKTEAGIDKVNDILDKLYARYKAKGLIELGSMNKIKYNGRLVTYYDFDDLTNLTHFTGETDAHPSKTKPPKKNIVKIIAEKWKNLSKGKRRFIKISSLVVVLTTLAACIGSCSKNSSSNENIFGNNGKSDGNIEDTEIDFGDGLGLDSSDEDVVNTLRNEEYNAEDCKFDIERTNEYTAPDQFLSFRDQVDYYISEKEHCNFEDMVDIDDAPTIREITKALESTYNDPSKEVQFGQWITGYLCDGITTLNGVKIKPYKGGYSTSIDRYIAVGIGAYYRTNGIITDPRVDEEVIRFDAGFEETMKGYH